MKTVRTYHEKTSRFLVLLFLGTVIIVGLNVLLEKSAIHHSVMNRIEKGLMQEELVHFKFSKAESAHLEWKEAHEFKWEGEMYDVIETRTSNDSIFYTCFHDREETKYQRKLYRFLSYLVDATSDNQIPGKKNALKVLKTFFFQTEIANNVSDIIINKTKNKYVYINHYQTLNISPGTPPPII